MNPMSFLSRRFGTDLEGQLRVGDEVATERPQTRNCNNCKYDTKCYVKNPVSFAISFIANGGRKNDYTKT